MANSDGDRLYYIMLNAWEKSERGICTDIEDWCRINGLTLSGNAPLPVSLVPHPIDRTMFDDAIESALLFNKLVHRIALNGDFILDSLKSLNDEFMMRLLGIFNKVREEGIRQRCVLGINRCDYMMDDDNLLKQVEINTISCAFAYLSELMPKFHRYLYGEWGNTDIDIVPNELLGKIVDAFKVTHERYVELRSLRYGKPTKFPIILMVTENGETNSSDQLALKYEIWNRYKIRMIRRSLHYIINNARMEADSGILYLDDEEIAIVYYRTGYLPSNYPTEAEWDARLLLERSFAIKSPDISFHLIGTKKIQQILSVHGILEKFFPSENQIVSKINRHFTELYHIDADSYKTIFELVSKDSFGYIMKPQREGGGNLITNDQMLSALNSMDMDELANYTLMKRIKSAPFNKLLYKNGNIQKKLCIGEIGIFCIILADYDGNILVNEYGGWLLRSKPKGVEDGGVVSGRAYLDSMCFAD